MLKRVNNFRRIFIILLVLSFCPKALLGQYYLYNEAPINIEANFTRHSIEASTQKTIFNVLIVKNRSNRQENLTLNITVPQGWTVIGSGRNDLTLNPLDSIIIPIRIAVGAKVKGDIGYSIIASLTDTKGNTVKNVYCFVKIPRLIDLNFRYIGKLSYLDPLNYSSDFSILIKNRGNREEPVNMLFDGNRILTIGSQNQQYFSSDVSIPPYTDTTFTFRTELKNGEMFGKNMYSLKSTIKTADTTLRTTFWFRKVESEYKNILSANDKPLTIELIGQGLLETSQKPDYTALIEGRTLFKGNSEIYYYYRNFSSRNKSDFYENTRMYLGGVVDNWNLEIGDSYRNYVSNLSGRGGFLAYKSKMAGVEVIINKNYNSQNENIGGKIFISPTNNSTLFAGAAFIKNNLTTNESKLGFIGTNLTFFKKQKIYLLAGYNELTKKLNGQKKHNEYGGELRYNSIIGLFKTIVNAKYGSLLYNSPQAGRFDLNAHFILSLKPKNQLAIKFYQNINNSPTIENDSITSKSKLENSDLYLEHTYFFSPSIQGFWGPSISYLKWGGAINFPAGESFSTNNYKFTLGFRFRNDAGTSILTPRIELAKTKLKNNPYSTINPNTNLNDNLGYQYFSLNYSSHSLNILAFYTSGPRSILEQNHYIATGYTTRKLQLMPSYNQFIYKDIVKLYGGISYTNDIISKSIYSNITGQLFFFLPRDWRLYVLGVYTIQKRTNLKDFSETYQNVYIEASIRKEFNIQHPRVKFYNIEFIFFKDFDGNFIQEENEPGVKNVLLEISREEDLEHKENIPGEFFNTELLSDNLGKVKLDRIPEGIYKIVYNPIGKDAGAFSKALEEMTLNVDKSKITYIPFVEKNKVFGKIVQNRSRLSGLGKLDLSNVRITATDSKGRTYTSLTDKNGEFVLYAPMTDQYIVNINNIFYENFDLRQNNFKVQFNGYKQFEVNFVFDEKIRRINFSPSAQDAQLANVLQVRKTNLKGSVKDASTLLPIRARVNIINTKTNTVLTSMYSSSQTGDYNISFMADDNYLLEIMAEGYWYNSENLNLNQVTTFLNVTKDVLLKPIAIGSKIDLNIRFDINKADLAAESVAELNRLIKLLKDNGNIKIEVQGHSDDLEALSNPQISEERAKRVARYLIENGFSNIQIRGFGNTIPVASNDTEDGRTANRRVEVEVVSK